MNDHFRKVLDSMFPDRPGVPEHPMVTVLREATAFFDSLHTPVTPTPKPIDRAPADVSAELDATRKRLETMTLERDAWKRAFLAQEAVLNTVRATVSSIGC